MARLATIAGRPEKLFFPAALLLSAAIVPVKAAEWAGALDLPALPPLWHGREMLFGVAYGVIGGYLLVGRSRSAVAMAFAAWLAGRLSLLLFGATPVIAAAIGLLYPVALSWLAGGRFARAAKSWRNAVFAPILGALALAQGVYAAGEGGLFADGGRLGLLLSADLVFVLMFAMGGRIIAGASSGAHQAQGRKLAGVAQPGLERVGLAALAAMLLLEPWPAAAPAAGLLAAAGALVVLFRLRHWQAWRLIGTPEVSLLHLGYVWLAAGLLAKGWAQVTANWPVLSALHAGLVGAFGTLALTMILRASLQRGRRPVRLGPPAMAAILLLSPAALARLAALLEPSGPWMMLSAALWEIAMLIGLAETVRAQRPSGGRSRIGA